MKKNEMFEGMINPVVFIDIVWAFVLFPALLPAFFNFHDWLRTMGTLDWWFWLLTGGIIWLNIIWWRKE